MYLCTTKILARISNTCVYAVNEAYVLMAIILCVWLLVKLLPGMEP